MSELSADARAILDAGRAAMAPTDSVRARVRAVVDARVASSVAGASAAGMGVKLVLLACLGIGILGALVIGWRIQGSADEEPRVEVPATAASHVPSTAPEPVVTEITRDPSPAPKTRSRPRQEVTTPGLAEELALLGKARAALRSGMPGDAIAVLDRHRREIRSPQLEREALVLRAEALCAQGDREAGERTLNTVAKRWPDAAGIEAVRSRCGR